jgi:hypothetical protein
MRLSPRGFAGLEAFPTDELGPNADGVVEQVFGQVASGTYFEVLGVQPAAGRLLTKDDEASRHSTPRTAETRRGEKSSSPPRFRDAAVRGRR